MFTGKEREVLTKDAIHRTELLMKAHIERFIKMLSKESINYSTLEFKTSEARNKYNANTRLLEDKIYNLIVNISLSNLQDEEVEDDIILLLNAKRKGTTLSKSIAKHVKSLNSEIKAYIELSLYFNISVSSTLNKLKNNLKGAYKTDLIKKGYEEIKNPISHIIKAKGMTVKDGEYKTSIANTKRLVAFMILDTITTRQIDDMVRSGALGFLSHRGSSYPCPLCDSMVGYHTLNDANIPPYHGNCYCYITPVFKL